mmetsp:Transcript_28464/g.58047  ORF Transcript_28464/g.58047 Transcript_28464/m.58047 type:complete len:576 (-) Transcript_28464:1473-3200(-)
MNLNNTPQQHASRTAYYDPYTKSIQFASLQLESRQSERPFSENPANLNASDLPNEPRNETAEVLEGVIIEISASDFPFPLSCKNGKQLMAEVSEIVILDDDMSSLAVHSVKKDRVIVSDNEIQPLTREVVAEELTSGILRGEEDMPVASTPNNQKQNQLSNLGREELMQKQRYQQSQHYDEHKKPLSQHVQEKNRFSAHCFDELEEQNTKWGDLDTRQEDEIRKLQLKQHANEGDLIDVIFECTGRCGLPPIGSISGSLCDETVAKGTSPQPLQINKQDEIKAIIRDKNIGREERLIKLREIRKRYASLAYQNVSSTITKRGAQMPQTFSSLSTKESDDTKLLLDEMRREEIEAIMKDEYLRREEKRQKLADVKAKYSSAIMAASAVSQPPPKFVLSAPTTEKVSATNKLGRAAFAAVSVHTFNNQFASSKENQNSASSASFAEKTLTVGVNHELIPLITEVLERNDSNLTILKLDGRKNIDLREWESLFKSIENNENLTHLSLIDCGLDDLSCTPLVLALVDNESVEYLNLSYNRTLGDDIGIGLLKVLCQSNHILKKVILDGTKASQSPFQLF